MRSRISEFVIALAATTCLTTATHAQVVEPSAEALAHLDATIEEHLGRTNTPGALAAVVSRGEIVHLRTYGLANVELSVPVSDKSLFEIGSISKQFVTAAVMLLKEEGKVGLDDPIHQYLPYLPSEWVGVTVKQLMNHTSGIPDYEEIRTYDVYRYRLTPEEVIRIAHSRPMDFDPGTGRYYSNTGYFLLSMIVERIEGQPLGKVLKRRIFGPLGMTDTRFADPEAIIRNRAAGYWVNKAGDLINRNPTETSSTLGAGGLLSSVHDLAKWDAALYGDDFLSEASKTELWTPVILPNGENTEYGLGWRVTPWYNIPSQSHSGQVAGFNTNFSRFPEQEIAVIVFMNRYLVSSAYIKEAVLTTFMPDIGPEESGE